MKTARILVTSARGGVGVSSAALHVAAALAERGNRVLLIDLRTVGRSLDLLTSLSDSVIYDFGDLLSGRVAPARAILPVPGVEGLSLLPGLFQTERAATVPELSRTLALAEEAADAAFTVLDASLDPLAFRAATLVSRVLLVSDLSRVSLRAAADASAQLPQSADVRLLLNRFPICAGEGRPVPSVRQLLDEVRLPLAGIIPESPSLAAEEEEGKGMLLHKKDNLSIGYRNIAARLSGAFSPLLSGWRRIKRRRLLRQMLA